MGPGGDSGACENAQAPSYLEKRAFFHSFSSPSTSVHSPDAYVYGCLAPPRITSRVPSLRLMHASPNRMYLSDPPSGRVTVTVKDTTSIRGKGAGSAQPIDTSWSMESLGQLAVPVDKRLGHRMEVHR